MQDLKCEVCGQPAIGVGCSGLGAVSFAYCAECAAYGCEPYGTIVAMAAVENIHSLQDIAHKFGEDYEWMIFISCLCAGKTAAEFWADVAAKEQEMWTDLT